MNLWDKVVAALTAAGVAIAETGGEMPLDRPFVILSLGGIDVDEGARARRSVDVDCFASYEHAHGAERELFVFAGMVTDVLNALGDVIVDSAGASEEAIMNDASRSLVWRASTITCRE